MSRLAIVTSCRKAGTLLQCLAAWHPPHLLPTHPLQAPARCTVTCPCLWLVTHPLSGCRRLDAALPPSLVFGWRQHARQALLRQPRRIGSFLQGPASGGSSRAHRSQEQQQQQQHGPHQQQVEAAGDGGGWVTEQRGEVSEQEQQQQGQQPQQQQERQAGSIGSRKRSSSQGIARYFTTNGAAGGSSNASACSKRPKQAS